MEKLIRNTTKVKTYYTIQGEEQNGTADSAVAATQKQTASTKPSDLPVAVLRSSVVAMPVR